MPALPEALVESELFGIEKGVAIRSRKRRVGRIESANGGTLLLDEIGDLNLTAWCQAHSVSCRKGKWTGVGRAGSPFPWISGSLAATNKDLKDEIKNA